MRLQRWAIILSGYNYTLKYKTGTSNSNADCLSRFPKDCESDFSKLENLVFLTGVVEPSVTSLTLCMKGLNVKNESTKDPIISRVINYIQFVSPTEKALSPVFDPYKNRKVELSIDQGCWGNRAIIPKALQPNVLESLHEANPGMFQMKSLARSYFWWVKIDEDIEKRLKCVNPAKNISQCLSQYRFINGKV